MDDFVYETALEREDDRGRLEESCARTTQGMTCSCSDRSSPHQVFTCPVCVRKTLGMMDRAQAQIELLPQGAYDGTHLPF